MRYIHIFFIFILSCIAGCAHTSAVMLDSQKAYPPTKNVQIITAPINRNFIEIAILESRGPVNMPTTELLADMREKAAEIGADGIIPTQESTIKQEGGIIYNPWLGGYQSTGGGSLPVLKGLAIKFVDEK